MLILLLLILLLSLSLSSLGEAFTFSRRSSYNESVGGPLLPEYDYIVVGCGVAGLTVSMRLTENNVTVLCLEAGPLDAYEEGIQFPVDMGMTVGSQYDWGLRTIPQNHLDGQTRPIPQGRGVGGGSLINGMIWNRGHMDDFRAWEALGNEGWGWEEMLGYFRKSENYTPIYVPGIPPQYQGDVSDLTWNYHGFAGPIHVSYPKYYWNQTVNFFQALEELNVSVVSDPNAGGEAGGYYLPASMHPINQTRSDARRAYFDPYIWRQNFEVLYNSQVTQILFQNFSTNISQPLPGGNESGRGHATSTTSDLFGGASVSILINSQTRLSSSTIILGPNETLTSTSSVLMTSTASALSPLLSTSSVTPSRIRRAQPTSTENLSSRYHATAVEFAIDASSPRQTARARREVIIAAGALHSPQLLQLSGFGPESLLQRFNIPVAQDLPGVGNNLQDHAFVSPTYQYNNNSYANIHSLDDPAFNASAETHYRANKTGPWTARVSTAIAFLSLPQIANDSTTIISSAWQNGTDFLPPGYETTLRHGYDLQRELLSSRLSLDETPCHEILNNNAGTFTITLQRPFSRGYVEIRSNDPFDTPLIDPRWVANPADFTSLMRAIDFNQRILETSAFNVLHPSFTDRPPRNARQDELRSFITQGITTEFHPSGTCAMLPRDQGGVVDPRLLVYGTDNLRVVDASMMPLIPGAHLMAPTYAVAEKAADIIKMAAGDAVQLLPVPGGADSARSWQHWMRSVLGLTGGEDTRGSAEQ